LLSDRHIKYSDIFGWVK